MQFKFLLKHWKATLKKFALAKFSPYTALCILDGIVCIYCTISLAGTS